MTQLPSSKKARRHRAHVYSQRRLLVEYLEHRRVLAASAYAIPAGGWAYQYDGSQDANVDDAALDGGWDHTQNDQWDGSGPGEEGTAPGGVRSITEGDETYLRIQDAGDPRDLGFPDPPSNRKISLNRNLVEQDGISPSFLDEGFTFNMRVRLATDGPLDDVTFGGQQETWPAAGRGSDIDFDGTGFFTLNQKESDNLFIGPISFALADPEFGLADLGADAPEVGGLLVNNLVGFEPSAQVDTHEITDLEFELNLVPVEDLTAWHEFWITIQAADLDVGEGTHVVSVYVDGSTTPDTFEVTMGNASRFEDFCICPSFTGGATAVDIDFLNYANGVNAPAIAPPQGPAEIPDVGVAYDGDWVYAYDGGQDSNADVGTLDGAWTHTDNDQWDGSGPAQEGSAPGGVVSITEGDVTYLRIQDAGDPRDLGFPDPPSNRKISLNRDMSVDGIIGNFLDEGFTFSFRARLATEGPLDDVTFGGQQEPWPAGGRGSDIDFDGTGFFTIGQTNPISFALADVAAGLADLGENAPEVGGLIMNNLAGDVPSPLVDTHEVSEDVSLNLLPIDDLTAWHEFWITIVGDTSGGGTHKVNVYLDGSTEAQSFDVTIGAASRFEDFCICPSFTSGATAVDIDFVAYQAGVVEPTLRGGGTEPLPGDINGDGAVNFSDFLLLSAAFNTQVDPPGSGADLDGDGNVAFGDFLILSANFNRAAAAVDAALAEL